LAVQLGYLGLQATVFVVEFTDAGVGEGEPLPQGASELRWVWSITGGLVGR